VTRRGVRSSARFDVGVGVEKDNRSGSDETRVVEGKTKEPAGNRSCRSGRSCTVPRAGSRDVVVVERYDYYTEFDDVVDDDDGPEAVAAEIGAEEEPDSRTRPG
jgi:hypothetical protein